MADPLYLSLSHRPRAIVQAMDELAAQRSRRRAGMRRLRRLGLVAAAAGVPFLALDLWLGYNARTFSLVALAAWVAAALLFVASSRRRGTVPQGFGDARTIVHTLRDDLHPRRPAFFGHLDLTGTALPEKLSRTAEGVRAPVDHYRDEWLSLKAKLWDGSMLRLSLVHRRKVRRGYWKRSRVSGKNKWKAEKVAELEQLKVQLTPNPDRYGGGVRPSLRPGEQLQGGWTIEGFEDRGGTLAVVASAAAEGAGAEAVLAALKELWGRLVSKEGR